MEEYFRGRKNLLITGSTGFVGLVLVKTILAKLNGAFGTLVLPVRKIDSLPADVRGDERVVILEGFDLSLPGFGLSKDQIALFKNVHICYHSAAVVQWNLSFGEHLRINTLASLELYDLVQSPHLEVFVACSTTAVGALQLKEISITSRDTGKMIEDIDKGACRVLQESMKTMTAPTFDPSSLFPSADKKTVGRSFYAYSKLVMEHLLYLKRSPNSKTTILIARLCNIDAACSFPTPGFAHKYHGAGTANLKDGIIGSRLLPDTEIFPVNSYPVDVACNLLLAHTAFNSKLTPKTEKFRVLNFESNRRNPVSILERFEASSHLVGPVRRIKMEKALKILMEAAKAGDVKAKINLRILRWYVPSEQKFYHDDNVRAVLPLLSRAECDTFPCDIALLDWKAILRSAADLCFLQHQQQKASL